jgi:hypothetical protein
MKQLLTACLLFFTFIGSAQGISNKVASSIDKQFAYVDINTNRASNVSVGRVTPEMFGKRATANHIKSRTFKNIKGADEGFYIIAGVFANLDNAQDLVHKLKGKGFAAGNISYSGNGLNYVYLSRFDTLDNAIVACNSKLDGSYTNPFWLMNIDNGGKSKKLEINGNGTVSNLPLPKSVLDSTLDQEVRDYPKTFKAPDQEEKPGTKTKNAPPKVGLSVEEVTYDMLSPVGKNDLPKTGEKASNTNNNINANAARLIKKADEYFNKMWYAEAAELY